jgi:hypothetical protein
MWKFGRMVLICGQALEGKDVKDLLLNVGSGGGAAPAAAGGAAAGGDAPAAEEAKEEKEEGTLYQLLYQRIFTDIVPQRRKSQTKTWASVCSTKRLLQFLFLRHFALFGVHKTDQRSVNMHIPILGPRLAAGCPWRCQRILLMWKT